jgi:parallel beta-helix repeat protein
MRKKIILLVVFVFVFIGMLLAALKVQKINASGTIYIRADGSVDPSSAPIQRDGNLYTFTGNITDSIVVQRDNIVIDGAGYAVEGTGAFGSKGIDLSDRNKITIRNCLITQFGCGIYLSYSSGNTICRNDIRNNHGWFGYSGVALPNSNGNTVFDNVITNNGADGISLGYSDSNVIYGNNITKNGGSGISLYYGCSNNNMSENTIDYNDNDGIAVLGSASYRCSDNTISENTIRANGDEGVYLQDSDTHVVSGNILINNIGDGIALYGAESNTISENDVKYNGNGIYLSNSHSNTILHNNITDSKKDGIHFDGSRGNTVSVNNIESNTYDGISFFSYSQYNTISGNKIEDNRNGIYFSSSNLNTISDNNITINDCGINSMYASLNKIFHNNFVDNTEQVRLEGYGYSNTWDNGYPSGGNYWSDFKTRYPSAEDVKSGPLQNESGSDGFWDTPYVIGSYNRDNYPIVPEFSSFLILPLFMVVTLLAVIVYRRNPKSCRASHQNFTPTNVS